MTRSVTARSVLAGCVTLVMVFASPTAQAQKQPVAQDGPRDYRSKNFLVHSDLSPTEAKDLLEQLETMLGLISRYWGRPNRQLIECYVVKDLSKWPQGVMDPRGAQKIQQRAGITFTTVRSQGGRIQAKAIVYAYYSGGTPLHEAVHAYCGQTFGTTGPVWYSEGMAEMGAYWKVGDSSVNVSPGVMRYLKQSDPKSLNQIINGNETTGDSWQNYAWRWALCHLLANNKNYQSRFRPLGLGLLTKSRVSFEQVYGAMAEEIIFEYLFFLEHMEKGYRVDLCSWDWKTKFRKARKSGTYPATIQAKAGWQAGRLEVTEGEEYEFSATGTCKLEKDGTEFDADGNRTGPGKLVGIIFDDYKLSEEFELGTYGSFKAPKSGKLFLRVRDNWGELADNTGKLSVKLRIKDPDNPLPKPTE